MTVPLQPPPKNLDKLSVEEKVREMSRWMYEVYRRMKDTGLLSILFTGLDFTGSSLSSIATRAHAQLQSILGVDVTSTNTAQDKHVSNANGKRWEDGAATAAAAATAIATHSGASSGVHGVLGSVVGTTDTQTLTNKTIILTFASSAVNLAMTTAILQATAAITVTLPTAVGKTGESRWIDNASTGNVTVQAFGVETIEGLTSQTLYPSSCLALYSDGTGWRIQ